MTDKFKKLPDPIKDIQLRRALVKKWENRVKKLKKKGRKQNDFCLEHGICYSWFSRTKTLNSNTPKWNTIKKIEAALEKEGV